MSLCDKPNARNTSVDFLLDITLHYHKYKTFETFFEQIFWFVYDKNQEINFDLWIIVGLMAGLCDGLVLRKLL